MISIIIPVYNHAEELKQCLASIAAQTLLRSSSFGGQAYQDIEVIVVDDGSSPALNAGEFPISNFQFPIQFLRQQHIGGSESAQRARNLGFKHSKGEYVMFCDADVIMRPTMLEKMLEVLDSATLHSNNILRSESRSAGRVEKRSYVYSGFRLGHKAMPSFPFSAERLRSMPYIHMGSLMRRECFPGMDERLSKFQDWDLYLTLLEKGYTGIWIPEILYTIIPRKRYSTCALVRRSTSSPSLVGISLWLPGFMYKIPWKKFGIRIGAIERYHEGMAVIKEKHKLTMTNV